MNQTDEILIEKCLDGDNRAYDLLLEKYLKQVYNFILAFVSESEQAQDITQETFIKTWRNLHRFKKDKSFKTWIFTIAKNTAYDFLKKKKTIPFSYFLEKEDGNPMEKIQEDSPLPDEILYKKDLEVEILEKLNLIPEKHRLLLTLRYKENFSLQEIATILEKPYNTVKVYHQRALKSLREVISG